MNKPITESVASRGAWSPFSALSIAASATVWDSLRVFVRLRRAR
jgi:hypothetical protein